MNKKKDIKASIPSDKHNVKAAINGEGKKAPRSLPSWGLYLMGFILMWIFCCLVFGPVFRHLADENYFCTDRLAMEHVLSEPFGNIYWCGRFLLMMFQWQLVGGTILALLLTLSAWSIDRCMSARLRGAGFLLPVILMTWTVSRGYNLYMRCDPSQWLVVTIIAVIVSLIIGIIVLFIKKGAQPILPLKKQYGTFIMVVATIGLSVFAWQTKQNVILSCSMQNRLWNEDWQGMVSDAMKAKHPDRSVAAFYTIACNQQHLLLENLFNISFNFDDAHLDDITGLYESENYIAEMDFHAGMTLSAYRTAMGHLCLLGPRLRYMKIMAVSAIIEGDQALAQRFLTLIDKMPGQHAFVEKYQYLLDNPDQSDKYPAITRLIEVAPQITAEMNEKGVFEQDFRQPIFIGYNLAATLCNEESLYTSMAAALYVKSLDNVVARARVMRSQGIALPTCVQQAIAIAAMNRKGLLEEFSVDNIITQQVNAFSQEVKPFVQKDDKEGAISALHKSWMGTYMYYYYCENLAEREDESNDSSVN